MYSDALRIMDGNTEQYMIDELKAQLAKLEAEKDAVISQQDATISQLTAEIQRLRTNQVHYDDSD